MVKRDLVSCPGRQANPMSLRGSNNVKTHWLQTFCCFVLLVVVLAPRAVVAQDSTGTTTRVSVSSAGQQGNYGDSWGPSLSADGRFVAFTSYASNLVAGDTNDAWDIFVHERDGVAGAPTVTGFSPTSGPVGTSVTIDGTNFIGATAVTFNGTNQPAFTVVSATQITAAVPAGATTGPIAVTTTTGTATSAADFIVTVVPAKAIFLPAITADGR